MDNSYTLTIDGEDRSKCLLFRTLTIHDESGDSPSSANFKFEDRDGLGVPNGDEEIQIVLDEEIIFGGFILKKRGRVVGGTYVTWSFECTDYNRELDRNLVVEGYQGMTDKAMIQDIVSNYCPLSGITTNNVVEGITISSMAFNYTNPSECFRKIARYTGRYWYIDYEKDLHYFPLSTESTPFDITNSSGDFKGLEIGEDNSTIKNRVYVRGGTYLSDATTIEMVADGEQTVFNLPDKPSDLSMTVDGVSKTIGIKNIDDPASYDYLLNYQEKYVEVGSDSTPANGDIMAFTYKYNIPILVALEDRTSIQEVGQFEFAIFDNKILTVQGARDRATAELTDYANALVDGSFQTRTHGFRAGQYININRSDLGVNADYLVQSVSARSMGGGKFTYTINIASAKKIGIIQLLIKMLEDDKNFLNISEDEEVDELYTVDGDSVTMTDSVPVLSSQQPPFKFGFAQFDFAQFGDDENTNSARGAVITGQ